MIASLSEFGVDPAIEMAAGDSSHLAHQKAEGIGLELELGPDKMPPHLLLFAGPRFGS